MRITFQIQKDRSLPELLFCWRLLVEAPAVTAVTDLFIPELFFDYFYVETGAFSYLGREQKWHRVPGEVLKSLYTGRLDLLLEAPLILFGARFSLSFAELYWQERLPANMMWAQRWLTEAPADLAHFTAQVVSAIERRRSRRTPASPLRPSLAETSWLAAYSPRHKRRLYKSIFGISKKEMWAIHNMHQFLGQSCDFSAHAPRIINYVNTDSFYDQPHFNKKFKKLTGLTPLTYFEANSMVQDNLMAVSYNSSAAG